MPQIAPKPTHTPPPVRRADLTSEPVLMGEASSRPAPGPHVDGADQFVFTHQGAAGWHVHQRKIRPRLTRRPLVWGVNGVDMIDVGGGKMRFDLAGFRTFLDMRREKLIPYDVDAKEGHPSYIRKFAANDPTGQYRDAYVDRFTSCYSGSGMVTRDEDAYGAWLDSLVERGIIDPPDRLALEMLLRSLETQLDALRHEELMRRGTTDDIRARREMLIGDMDTVREAIAALTTGPAAAAPSSPAPAIEDMEARHVD